MTEPKEGDQVRCTLGENVIVGTVLSLDKIFTDTYLSVVFGDKRQVLIDPSVWTVEVIEPEIDNFPTTPGPYEVTWEDGTASDFNPYEVREDGLYRLSHNGSWSKWHKPDVHLRRATWKRLPAPVPPEPPVGTLLRDRYNNPWWRLGNGWRCFGDNPPYTWQQIQEYGPFARQIDAPDPNDEQQVEALAQAMRRADGRAQLAGLDVARSVLTFLRDGGA